MLRNSFFKIIPFLFVIVLFNSCDKEFNTSGGNVVGDSSFGIVKREFTTVAYNQKLEAIQSNNLPINAFGIYEDPAFGTTTASFVTQVGLLAPNPTIDKSAKIKSAILTIPYFIDASKTVKDSKGISTYVLDSIYGPSLAKMKLSVYESGYYMMGLDPTDPLNQGQKFYSNQYSEFTKVRKNKLLNNSEIKAQNEQFFFDPAELSSTAIVDKVETTIKAAPAMKLTLDATFFQEKILNAPSGALVSNVAFREYFRGLFFDIESIGSPGSMAMMNFKGGEIAVAYTETIDKVVTDKVMIIQLLGNTVSLLNQTNSTDGYSNATKPSNVNKVKGDPTLYLKGGEGAMSIVNLFGEDKFGENGVSGTKNGVADELDVMRYNNYLVNQAELTFRVNSEAMTTSYFPQRVYLYDFTNSTFVDDYTDSSAGISAKYNRVVYGGFLQKDTKANGGGYYYKFRITRHIKNLVKNHKLINVQLGLVVTEDINNPFFYSLRDIKGFPLLAPMASVMNPLGTIIVGSNVPLSDVNYKNRTKFEIYYTKTN